MISPTAFLSAMLLYTVPVITGRPIYKKLFQRKIRYSFITYFMIGALILYALAIILNYTLLIIFPQISFKTLLYVLFGLGTIIGALNLLFDRPDLPNLPIKKYILPIFISLLLASIVYFLWQYASPYPFNWDIYEHQTLVNTMISDRFSFIPSRITDTFGFNGYSTLPHVLISLSQLSLKPEVFEWWHAISYIHFVIIIAASFFLTIEITENKSIAIISVLISAFIFDDNISFTTLFFLPQTFTAMVFIYLFIQLLSEVKRNQLPTLGQVLLGSVFLVLNHYFVGSLAAVLYIASYFYFKYRQLLIKKMSLLVVVGTLGAIIIAEIILSRYVYFGFLNKGEAASFTSSLPEKFKIMRQVFGYLMLIFLPIGVINMVKEKKELQDIVLVITAFLISFIMQPVPYVMKSYVLTGLFVNFIIAFGIYTIIKNIKNPGLLAGAYFFLIIVLFSIFTTNSAYWQGSLIYRNTSAHISSNEIAAANFLENKYKGKNAFLISDPATQHILEPFSQVNTQGGAYMRSENRGILDEISQTANPKEIASALYTISDVVELQTGPRLLALSGRYFLWQKSGRGNKYALAFNIWNPADLNFEDKKMIQRLLSDRKYFRLMYENPTIAILEVYQ